MVTFGAGAAGERVSRVLEKHPANENNRARAEKHLVKVRKPLTKRGFFAPVSLD
jgi:hypothetical protein